jgi:DNA-binding MarR family transcriptional regulator
MVQRKKALAKEKKREVEGNPTAHQGGLLQWKAYRTLEQALELPMKKQSISAPEWKLLGLVFDRGEMQATEVAFLMDVKLPLVTRNVTTLKNKKLIAIENHKEDKRIKLITVTAKGKDKLFAIEKDVRAALGNVFQGVTKDEMQQYKNVLKKIVGNK